MAEGGDDDLFVDFISQSTTADVVDNAVLHAPAHQRDDNNNNNNNSDTLCPNGNDMNDCKSTSLEDFLFNPNFIESNVDNVAFMKTTHVTGFGVSCELVSGVSHPGPAI